MNLSKHLDYSESNGLLCHLTTTTHNNIQQRRRKRTHDKARHDNINVRQRVTIMRRQYTRMSCNDDAGQRRNYDDDNARRHITNA